MSTGIAHEIQNPLNFVINFSKMSRTLLNDLRETITEQAPLIADNDRKEIEDIIIGLEDNLHKIVEHGNRAISIVHGILLYARGKEGTFIPTLIQQLAKEYVWLSYHAMRANYKNFNVAIHENYDEQLQPVNLIPQKFSRAIVNVMNNACYAVWKKQQRMPANYQPTISISLSQKENNIVLTIKDNGEGMNDEVKKKLFETFFTTKEAGQGTGLGMSIVRDIIENKHHGQIEFDSVPNEFSYFKFIIPLS